MPKRRRGSRSFVTEGGAAVAVHWDIFDARYPSPSSPEPCGSGYYLAVVADTELVLLLGAGGGELSRHFGAVLHPQAVLLSRLEQIRGEEARAGDAGRCVQVEAGRSTALEERVAAAFAGGARDGGRRWRQGARGEEARVGDAGRCMQVEGGDARWRGSTARAGGCAGGSHREATRAVVNGRSRRCT